MNNELLCWWCCHPPMGSFLNMPIKQNRDTRTYTTIGNFCSWECMKAYALDKYNIHKSGIICMYIRCMREDRSILKSAPARLTLKCFGGPLTIEKFRENSCSTIRTNLTCIDHKVYEIVEQTKPVHTNSECSESKMKHINSASSDNDSLRLKRTKPLKRDIIKNNLEHSLGILKK